ncbi:hypothetical protein [Pelosinus sp. IPA-1]|uniref:hypothetical protein n=1 Tax=Pelosinus sp. IPA-1 TaxID=3029569 RepID=UPI00243618D2|nr:hypothetical protein [Pelosinus sp. IPA-1]GMA99459.1 hypothetical protein PIPA1_22590 [Pelosinus sp. IPA-1]
MNDYIYKLKRNNDNDKITNWQEKFQDNEWYFHDLRTEITCNLEPVAAYNLLPEVIDLILKQNEVYVITECFQLLFEVYRAANTTEIHPYLLKNITNISYHVESTGEYGKSKVAELKSWLRLEN